MGIETRASKILSLLTLGAGAILPYLVLPIVIYLPVLSHPATQFMGDSGDGFQFMWFLGWFWHALLHGQNPFISRAMNYPYGVDLMANTSVIAESILFGPLALLVSSTFAYNTMMFVNICVMGILGRHVLAELGVRKWVALIGGLFFQVLPYTTAQFLGHANLVVTAWLIGALYVVLRMHNRRFSHPALAGMTTGILLTGEFYTSVEVFATCAFMTATAIVCGLLFARQGTIAFLRRLPWSFVVAGAVTCIVLVAPGIYLFELGPYAPTGALISKLEAVVIVNDLLNFVVPTPVYMLHNQLTQSVTAHFTGDYYEDDGYIGIVGLILMVWAAVKTWHRPFTKMAVPFFIVIAVLSLGILLHVNGHILSVPMPWYLVTFFPVINEALPSRLMFYGDVVAVLLLFIAFEVTLGPRVEAKHISRNLYADFSRGPRRVFGVGAAALVLFVAWLPAMPYVHTTVPNLKSIQPGGSLYPRLVGQPTLVLTDNFDQVMQTLADGRYTIPVANVYAFQNDTPAQGGYRPFGLSMAGLSGQALASYLAGAIVATGVRRVLFAQSVDGTPIPHALLLAMNQICGQPAHDSTGRIDVWNVPRNLPAVSVAGDVWNPVPLYGRAPSLHPWVGQDWSVRTTGVGATVTLTVPPHASVPVAVIQVTGAIRRTLRLKDGQGISLFVPPNRSVSFHGDPALNHRYIQHGKVETVNVWATLKSSNH